MTKVLVVDDTPDMVRLLKQTVEDHGYTALVACNGEQALQTASDEHPDTILLDVMMPGLSGMEVLRRLKSDPDMRNVPVILVFTTKDVGKGTGQGLTITHSIIVEKHGGTITFDTAVGDGTTFIIRLPISERDSQNEIDQGTVVGAAC